MFAQDGAHVASEKPFFVIVEAKRNAEMDQKNSTAQLLAQIRALQIAKFGSSVGTC